MSTLIAGAETRKISALELSFIDPPAATPTHKPVKHSDIVTQVEAGLAMRSIQVIRQEYAVSPDGMKMFGLMVTNQEFDGCNYAIGLRNANDKSMKLGMVAGFRVMVCENMAFAGDFNPLLAKHTSNFELQDAIILAIDRVHRGLLNVSSQVEKMKHYLVRDTTVKEVIYDAFIGKTGMRLPKMIMDDVHENYFNSPIPEFQPGNAWTLHNSFTSSLKKLNPVRQFQETGRLTPFLFERLGLN
jgi:hypothetical protein